MGNSLEMSTCFNIQQKSLGEGEDALLMDLVAPSNQTNGGQEKAVRFLEPPIQHFLTLNLQNPDFLEKDDASKHAILSLQSPYPGETREQTLDERALDSFLSSLDDISNKIPQDHTPSPVSPATKNRLTASKSPRRSKAKKSPRMSMSPKEINRISNPTSPAKSPVSTGGLKIVFTEEVFSTFQPSAELPKPLPSFSAVQQTAAQQVGKDRIVSKKDAKKKSKPLRSLFGKLVKAVK